MDSNYLSSQFAKRVFTKNGAEFQAFFADIMEKAFLDFQRIRPYGREGDGGNDGYRRDSGTYYQVYAPNEPIARDAEAAVKFHEDFSKVMGAWDQISPIREYVFVHNDKYLGSTIPLEAARAELEQSHPTVSFRLLLAKDLEILFFTLNPSDMLILGFDVDSLKAREHARSYLEGVGQALDREEIGIAARMLEKVRDIVQDLGDSGTALELQLLECRILQKTERQEEALALFEKLSDRFPSDPRPLLYRAELRLAEGDLDGNLRLLQEAEQKDPDHWLLQVQRIIRGLFLGPETEPVQWDQATCPQDPRLAAIFFRVCGRALQVAGRDSDADSYIASSKLLNPERCDVYLDEVRIIENRLRKSEDSSRRLELARDLLEKTDAIEAQFSRIAALGPRARMSLQVCRLTALEEQEKISSVERAAKTIFDLALACHFDTQVEHAFLVVLSCVQVHADALQLLLKYLKNSRRKPSEHLHKLLFAQFGFLQTLSTDARAYFESVQANSLLELIAALEGNDSAKVLELLGSDDPLAVLLAGSLKGYPEIRKAIIEHLPEQKNLQKEKLRLLLNLDEKDLEQAFEILRGLDLSELRYAECRQFLALAHQKRAWEFVLILVEKLLDHEENDEVIFRLKLHRCEALQHVQGFATLVELGAELLAEDKTEKRLNDDEQEALLAGTVQACLERGKIESRSFTRAIELLQAYGPAHPSLEFKVGIEAEAYLRAGDGPNALRSILEGVSVKKVLSAQEYARLYIYFVRLGQYLPMKQDSARVVGEGTFVKLASKSEWYYLGNGNELNAIKISPATTLHAQFHDKAPGDRVSLGGKYGPDAIEDEIELILEPPQYVHLQAVRNFQELAPQGVLEGVQVINLAQTNDSVDLQNLIRFFEDLESNRGPFFDLYCKGSVPLALLAASEGGFTEALGRIETENRGFVNMSLGTAGERERQMEIARLVLKGETAFYMDGSSAVVLAESGMLTKIRAYITSLRVPQSVLTYLADVADRFVYTAGQTGHLGYTKGRLILTSLEPDKRERIRSRFLDAIRELEATPEIIRPLSRASKTESLSETKVPSELVDACILARNEDVPVLTEDFLYVKMNEAESGKKAPPYFSSIALVRALYEEGKLSHADYLKYFGFLSSYRFRFLSVSSEDIQKAIFGDGTIKTAVPTNIRSLNLPLTMSEEYGVSLKAILIVVSRFMVQILIDSAITPDLARLLFIELIEAIPSSIGKKDLGQLLLRICERTIDEKRSEVVYLPDDPARRTKFNDLMHVTELYSWQQKIRAPS